MITALGNVQRARKKYEEAAETYSRAIALIGDRPASNYWTTFYFRGTAYERAKQWPKAEADLKKALSLVPASQLDGQYQRHGAQMQRFAGIHGQAGYKIGAVTSHQLAQTHQAGWRFRRTGR